MPVAGLEGMECRVVQKFDQGLRMFCNIRHVRI